jgi:hypothetical protein
MPTANDPQRRVVTVDTGVDEFDDTLLKSMIEQAGMTGDTFYGATKWTANKAQVRFVRTSAEPEGD